MNKMREWTKKFDFQFLGLISLIVAFWCAFAYCFIDSRVHIGSLVATAVMLMLKGILNEQGKVTGWKMLILYVIGVAIMIGMARVEGVSVVNSIIAGIVIPLLPWTVLKEVESFKD